LHNILSVIRFIFYVVLYKLGISLYFSAIQPLAATVF